MLFEDYDTADQIMKTPNPADQKTLGRTVKQFDLKTWNTHQADIARDALKAKFTQDTKLKEVLLGTRNKTLAEASPPWETTWGIGLHLHDPDITNKDKWKGKNLLGKVLMEVRSSLI